MPNRYDAVLFDLLTALLDSWSLWNTIAGNAEAGGRWRAEYLKITYRTGAYRPYGDLVAEAARAVGLERDLARQLETRYGELCPWPGVTQTLLGLKRAGIRVGLVTNCSEQLGRVAAGCLGADVDVLVTAERAGFYKPDPTPYRLGLSEIGAEPRRCLFVAGSAYDLVGTGAVGLDTYWHDRTGMTPPDGAPPPLAHEATLEPLLPLARGDAHGDARGDHAQN
jgi:2-haloalkanoic acid dehalogenase type II